MRLTAKLSFAIVLGICGVLAVHAWLRVQQDSAAYRSDVRRDHELIARSVAAAVDVLRDRDGAVGATELLAEVDVRFPHAAMRWVWLDETDPGERPQMPQLLRAATGGFTSSARETPGGETEIVSYGAVTRPGGRPGTIEIVESLAGEREFVRRTLVRTTITTIVLVLLCLALTLGFGVAFVARPMRELAAKAQRIGAGDLGGPIVPRSADEIGEVALAMNEMCVRLERAAADVAAETAARLRTLDQLRHLDRLRTVGELASGVAHELGTPLNTVRARGAMIAEAEVTPERARELGHIIVAQADRMTRIIRGLLDYARRKAPDRRDEDVSRVLEQTIDWVEPIAKKQGVRVRIARASDEGPRAAIDAGQLQQAITNLVVNAVHATPSGGEVVVSVGTLDDGVRIEVSDEGPGVPPEHLERVFEPFFTTKPTGEGTGLGLSVTEGIVREHGGTIEARNGPSGACFVIHLPRSGEPPAA